MMQKKITFLVVEAGQISPGASAYACARPQCTVIKPFKCFIHPSIAGLFTIGDIRVGNRSMFPAGQRMDASQFAIGDGHEMEVEPIMVSQDFIMSITNVGGYPSHFRANWACYLPTEVKNFVGRNKRYELTEGELLSGFEDTTEREQFTPSAVKNAPEAKARETIAKREHPGFGWDPGYGDD